MTACLNRARERAELVTDDRAGLKEQLEALSGVRIAALEAVGEEKAKAPEGGKSVGRSTVPEREMGRGAGRSTEPDKGQSPKSLDRDLGF